MARRGRPEWKPTAVQRRKVASAAAGGMPKEHIALALSVDVRTLEKHCLLELITGASQRRMEALDSLYMQAKRGNVAAAKAVLAIEANRIPAPPPAPGRGDEATTPAAPAPLRTRLGKKEQAQLAAGSAAEGTPWDGVLPTAGTTTVQ